LAKFISILLFISIVILSHGQNDSVMIVTSKDGHTFIFKENKDTLYTMIRKPRILFSSVVYHFRAYYPGTKLKQHEWISVTRPYCYDCINTTRIREWYYNEKGQKTKFFKEKTKKSGRRNSTSVSITKLYENGKLIKVEKGASKDQDTK